MADLMICGESVSRETFERLEVLAVLMKKWTARINLVAPNSVPDLWSRHIEDSAQVFFFSKPDWVSWTDIGSGGGLPALVIACLDEEKRPMTLIESDQRKCLFLNTVRRELDLNINVINGRIEDQKIPQADVISARALAPLNVLLHYSERLLHPSGTALFPKGRNFQKELDDARQNWDFSLKLHESKTLAEARILEISRITYREP